MSTHLTDAGNSRRLAILGKGKLRYSPERGWLKWDGRRWKKSGKEEALQLAREVPAQLYPEAGSPQGGVVSPVLSNVFLHYVLDDWFAREVQPRMSGRVFLIRYADDAIIGFTDERDAWRVLDVLPKRFGRYGLRLHPDKTRLVQFHRPPRRRDHKRPPTDQAPGTFDLLGFIPERELGGEAQDRFEPLHAGLTDDCPLVSVEPTPPDCRATSNTVPKATRPLRVLRDHQERFRVVAVSTGGDPHLAQKAVPPPTSRVHPVAVF